MQRLKWFLETIKFEHSLFALPFAYFGLFLGERGWPSAGKLFWVTLAMVGLRTVGMIANRLADFKYDCENPRTQHWPLSLGRISKKILVMAAIPSLFIYFLAAHALNPLCFLLAPIPCTMVFVYPFLKRFTWTSHIFLGGILGLAPLGGWVASRGVIAFDAVPLGIATLFWVAGFDILYALQDEDFDRSRGLFSIPACFGRRASLSLAFLFHLLTLISLVWLGRSGHLGVFYWTGVGIASLAIAGEHLELHLKGVVQVPKVFFLPNVSFSLIIFLGALLDLVKW